MIILIMMMMMIMIMMVITRFIHVLLFRYNGYHNILLLLVMRIILIERNSNTTRNAKNEVFAGSGLIRFAPVDYI